MIKFKGHIFNTINGRPLYFCTYSFLYLFFFFFIFFPGTKQTKFMEEVIFYLFLSIDPSYPLIVLTHWSR